VSDDAPDLRVVSAADLVDLLDQLAVPLHQPRVQGVALREALEILHRDADIQIVRARREDVFPQARGLVRHDGVDGGVEERGLEPRQHRLERFAGRPCDGCAVLHGRPGRRGEGLAS
jgi:hypothetical protein